MITGIIGAAAGAAAGAAGGLFGSLGRNKALKRQIRNIEDQKTENQAWFDRRYNEDVTQRADAQRMLQLTMDNIRKSRLTSAGTAAVMGGTNESVAAAKAANAGAMADTASQIAAAGAARKDAVESQYLERKNALQDKINDLDAQKANPWDVASNTIGGGLEGFTKGYYPEETKKA